MMMIVLRLLSLLGLKPRWHRHFSLRPLNKVVFQGGGGVAGFVDSWAETLVPSASNRSTPEWTLVDSVDSRHGRIDEQQRRASSGRVVEDDAQGEALAAAQARYAVAHRRAVPTAGAFRRPLVDREQDRVALGERHDLAT